MDGERRRGKIHLDTMDSFPCQMQECRSFKSDWKVKLKHVTSAFQPYKICILVIYNGSNTSKCDSHYVQDQLRFLYIAFSASLAS